MICKQPQLALALACEAVLGICGPASAAEMVKMVITLFFKPVTTMAREYIERIAPLLQGRTWHL